MSKIYTVINKKGGVAKSTTVSAIASICAHYGQKVLVVDLDPQTDSTKIFFKEERTKCITDIFRKSEEEITYDFIKSVIEPTKYPNIDIIVGDEDLDEEGEKLLILNGNVNKYGRVEIKEKAQMMLTKAFKIIEDDYDLILIDNNPSFNIISRNSLSASNGILIPVNTDGFSYDGLTKLLKKIYEVKRDLNTGVDIIGIFFTNVNKKTGLFRDLKDVYKEELHDKFLDTYIRTDNVIKEANTAFIPLYEYKKNAKKIPNATIDYMMLVNELKLVKRFPDLEENINTKY